MPASNSTGANSPTDDAALVQCACQHHDLRCACGSLLARRLGDAVELKCRRCKRTVLVPFETT
jgi:hypothetical protein